MDFYGASFTNMVQKKDVFFSLFNILIFKKKGRDVKNNKRETKDWKIL